MRRRVKEAPVAHAEDQKLGPAPSPPTPEDEDAPTQRAGGGFRDFFQTNRLKKLLLNIFILYASVPFIIRLFPSVLTVFVYLNLFSFPYGVDFQKPEVFLNHTRNFYLTIEPGVTLGIWQALPDNRRKEAEEKGQDHSWFEDTLYDDNPVIIYLHGNGGSRAASHRVQFAKAMSDGGFHVLAVDYRGYADSTGFPSEKGFTTDVIHVYNWVRKRSGNKTVVLWGHSLGTGIATNVARKLQEKHGIVVHALVLESPYTNIRDAAASIPIAKIYRKFPGFEHLILDTLARAGMHFPNDKNLQVVSSPVLILHSEDDAVLPVQYGKKLFEIAYDAAEKKENVKFLSFPASMGLGHDNISSHPNLAAILKNFLKNIK